MVVSAVRSHNILNGMAATARRLEGVGVGVSVSAGEGVRNLSGGVS